MNSLQRIFDAAWQAFIVGDKQPSYNFEERMCSYLDRHFNKCAVGLCIPDGHNAQHFIGGFCSLCEEYPKLFPDVYSSLESLKKSQNYFDKFQGRLHDNNIEVDFYWTSVKWKNSNINRFLIYLDVAKDYNLVVPIEQEYIVHNVYDIEKYSIYYV